MSTEPARLHEFEDGGLSVATFFQSLQDYLCEVFPFDFVTFLLFVIWSHPVHLAAIITGPLRLLVFVCLRLLLMGYVSFYHRNKPVCLLEGALTIAIIAVAALSTGEWIQAVVAVGIYTVAAYLLARSTFRARSASDDAASLKVTGIFARLGVRLLWVFAGIFLLTLLVNTMCIFRSMYEPNSVYVSSWLSDCFSFCWMVALASGVRALFFLWHTKKKEGIRSAPYLCVLLASVFIFSLSFCYASHILPYVGY